MKKTLAVLATVAAVGVTAVAAPAEARGRGIGPGLAFGLAAGAITAGIAWRRLRLGDFFSSMWLVNALRPRTLPVAVTLKRFLAPEWVFIFGIATQK